MPSIVGPHEPPFDPWDRPPTWLVPRVALNRRPTVLGRLPALRYRGGRVEL